MEAAGVRWLMRHGWSFNDAWAQLTDRPTCTDPLIFRAAQAVNDRLSDEGLLRLELRVDALIGCHSPSDLVRARRVRVRVSCWAARRVLDLVEDDKRRAVALCAIETAEAWLRGEATEDQCRRAAFAATASAASASDAGASNAAAAAAGAALTEAAFAAVDAASAASLTGEDALLDFLDDLIDQYMKSMVEEGCAADEPPAPIRRWDAWGDECPDPE
jgi:hypothetical protein